MVTMPLKRRALCNTEVNLVQPVTFSRRAVLHHAVALTTSDIGRFLLLSYFSCERPASEHAETGAAACVSLEKTRLPFLHRKNVRIIYDLASGGMYTCTRAWE